MRQNAWASLIEAHNALGGAPGVAKLRTHFEAHAMRGGGGGSGGFGPFSAARFLDLIAGELAASGMLFGSSRLLCLCAVS